MVAVGRYPPAVGTDRQVDDLMFVAPQHCDPPARRRIVQGREEQQVAPVVDYFAKSLGAKTFYLVGNDYVFGRGMLGFTKKYIEDHGGKVVGEEYLPIDGTDWTPILSKIRSAHPDALISVIRVDGAAERLMGNQPDNVPAMPQTGLEVTPTRTIYQFQDSKIHVTLTFMTTALPDDLDALSRPLTYVTWTVRSIDASQRPARPP